MSDAELSLIERQLQLSDRTAYLEQRLFVLSPFGAFPTALILFIVLTGSFAIIALAEHVQIFSDSGAGLVIGSKTRPAIIISLMLCTALFIQRYTRLKERSDRAAFAAILRNGALLSAQLASLTPPKARLFPASLIGLVLGIGLSWLLYANDGATGMRNIPGLFVWFFVVTTILSISFTRGVELSRMGSRASQEIIEHDLVIDLLRIDKLSVWGRSAARLSLIWFSVGAVSCLFFIDNGLTSFTISLIAIFAALGIRAFFGTMEQIHQKIRATKAAELERIRGQIDELREAAVRDPSAATRLQGLLAYESRIVAAPEWPFDQTTLVRVGASALILTVPWFGQAIAQYVVEHVSHIGG